MDKIKPHLWNAVVANNIPFVKILIESECNVELGGFTTSNNREKYTTPLCAAVDAGNNEMVKILLRGQADVLPPTRDYTPLQRAARKGFFEIVETLLKHNRSKRCNDQLAARFMNDSPYGGYTALYFALSTYITDETKGSVSRFKTVSTLIDYGVDVNELYEDGLRPIQIVKNQIKHVNASIDDLHRHGTGRDIRYLLETEHTKKDNLVALQTLLAYTAEDVGVVNSIE